MAMAVMTEHLGQKMNHFVRSDPLLVQANSRCPRLLIAESAATPARPPVTCAFGVLPRGAHVLPKNAVNDTLASS